MAGLNTLERDDLLRRIAWLNSEVDKIKRMLKGEQVGTARIADAAITNAKIKDLTWDKAQGGTATLGGLDNGNGLLQMLNSSGNQLFLLDNTGFHQYDGNDNEIITFDENGIDINSLLDDFVSYITFYKDGVKVGDISYRNYVSSLITDTDVILKSSRTDIENNDNYATIAIFDENDNRDFFSRIWTSYRNYTTFIGAGLDVSLDGISPSFRIIFDDTSGHGLVLIPSHDPSYPPISVGGAIFYDNINNKLKVCENGSWKTITTT